MSAEGDVIAGRYRLHERLGSGAMGVVWRALDERLHRTVAVKLLLLKGGGAEAEEARQRAMREGRITARLQHPNAVAVHDVAEHEGRPVLVMEYLPSRSLSAELAGRQVLPPLTAAGIGAQIAAALAAAHRVGIVHRDVKPGNVLLAEDGTAKITDFGISRAVGDVAVTQSGVLTGTPAYLAPETVVGCEPAPASDVFSLGSTLYAAVEGEPPFGMDANQIRLLHRVAGGRITPPRNAGPMRDVLVRMLQPDPADRPTMAETQVLLLQTAVDESSVTSTPGAGKRCSAQESGDAGVGTQLDVVAPSPEVADTRVGAAPSVTRTPHGSGGPKVAVATKTVQPTPESGTSGGHGKPRRRHGVWLWGTATAIAVIAGVLAVNPSGNAPGFVGAGEPSPEEIQAVVRQYYTLVPENPDQAFELLGPGMRSQGKATHAKFWANVEDVRIFQGPVVSGRNAEVSLVMEFSRDGKLVPIRVLGIIVGEDGRPLIDSDLPRT